MTGHFTAPQVGPNPFWTRVVLTDDHTREETWRAIAKAWQDDPAAVAEQLGLLVEVADESDAFASAVIDAETDLRIDPIVVDLRLVDAEALLRQLTGAVARVAEVSRRGGRLPLAWRVRRALRMLPERRAA